MGAFGLRIFVTFTVKPLGFVGTVKHKRIIVLRKRAIRIKRPKADERE